MTVTYDHKMLIKLATGSLVYLILEKKSTHTYRKTQNIVQAYFVMTVTYDHKILIKLAIGSLAYLIQGKKEGNSHP
jgi:hypothetical protein